MGECSWAPSAALRPSLRVYSAFASGSSEQVNDDSVLWRTLDLRLALQTRGVVQEASPPLPAALQPLMAALSKIPGMPAYDQLTVNDYPPGEGLSPHIDTHSAFIGTAAVIM